MFNDRKINNLESLRRFWVIVETVTAYGFHDFVGQFAGARKTRWHRKHQLSGKSRPERFRMLLEELGPTFVKLGQILSTRGDLIGREYANELAKLTEQATPVPYPAVAEIIREELGGAPEDIFAEFSPEPLAAASIGQAHAAKLKDGGQDVVVKVQRPGIRKKIELDLAIMRYLADKIDKYNRELAEFQPVRIVDEFAYNLRRELDFTCEGGNLLRFAKNQHGDSRVVVPKFYPDFSTVRVLTCERIFGDSCATVLADEELKKKYDLKVIADVGVDSMLKQIFDDGFFHGDPHPGNIFLLPDNRLCFLDFGMMGHVSEWERKNFLKALEYMIRGDISRMTDCALRMTISGDFVGSRDDLERDLGDLVDANINLPLEKLSVAAVMEKLLNMLTGYRLALRPNLYMMFKAIITVEHLGRSFDPSLHIVERLRPFLVHQKLRDLDPRKTLRRVVEDFSDNLAALQKLPKSLQNIASQAERGEFTVRMEHHRLDDLEYTLYMTGERLAQSLLVSAILIGSGMIFVSKTPPLWNDIPVIGATGFIIALLLSGVMMFKSRRKRRAVLRERAKRQALISENSRRRG